MFHKTLPNNKISDWFIFKVFADDKINVAKKMKFVFGKVENIKGKGENAGYQHFLLFPQCFLKVSSQDHKKLGLYGKEVTVYHTISSIHEHHWNSF